MIIEGKNPVKEALSAGTTIEKLYVEKGNFDPIINIIVQSAKTKRIPTVFTTRENLDSMSPSGRHQGVVASATEFKYADVEDIYALAESRGEPLFAVILDGITDPHNLGGIVRTCECAGAHGIIIPKHRAAGVNETVVKVSVGATEHILIAKVTNVNDVIRDLKDRGVYVFAADMGGAPVYDTDLTGSVAIVIGSEDEGVKRLTKELCDGTVGIPQYGKINSLNASVAAGVIVFERVRQSLKK